MKLIIDRFEGEYAICESVDGDSRGRQMVQLEKSKLPQGSEEGDVLVEVSGKLMLDKDETRRRKTHIEKLAEDLWS